MIAGCGFSSQMPGTETSADATVVIERRCSDPATALCVDFEAAPTVTDEMATVITASHVAAMPRLQETAARFDASSVVWVAETPRLDIRKNLTIEMWTRPTQIPAASGDKQAGLFDNFAQYEMNFESDGQVECSFGGTNLDSRGSLSLDVWHHVACTFDGSELRVYIDGKLDGCALLSTSRDLATFGIAGSAIGANLRGPSAMVANPFIGELDNVHVFARTFAADDICTMWGQGNCAGSCPIGGEEND